MPHPHLTAGQAGLDPVPVAVLLPPPGRAGTTASSSAVPARRGRLSAHAAAQVVTVYTRAGELVADLDANPTLAAAAHWLDRHHRAITGHGWATGPRGGQLAPRRAQLLVAALPRPGATRLAAMAAWLRHARARLVTPGGYLLVTVAATTRSRPGRGYADHATTVVAAARSAGWAWQQQLIDITEPLPDHDPATEATATAALGRARHRVVHQELLVFTTAGLRDG
jgi:hypothetical protein